MDSDIILSASAARGGKVIVLVHNTEIAAIFNELADLLEIEGANPFRIRAYRNAAITVASLPESLADMVKAGKDLSALPAIGKDLAAKIAEIVATGHLVLLDQLEKSVPGELATITAMPGLGPKRVKILHEQAGVTSLESLREAAMSGRIRELPGFGEKIEHMILRELDRLTTSQRRWRLSEAEDFAQPFAAYVEAQPGVTDVVIAGSYRRRRETVGDLDILATCAPDKAGDLVKRFTNYDEVDTVVSAGTTRSTVLLRCGLQVDLRVVPKESFGAALHYFTGSKAHNIAIRKMGVARGLKVNEYGVFRGAKRIAGRTEVEIYKLFGLDVVPPELRENRGEIEAAKAGHLPKLVTQADIRGDLHMHTEASDGKADIPAMAEAAKAMGYDYIAISDHSKHARVANGLDEVRLARQIDEIDRLNSELEGITILKSCEIDILDDGRLDLSDGMMSQLDIRIAAFHYKFDLPRDKQTERIIRAMDNPYFNIFAHPTGKLINQRPPYEIDIERIIDAARERGCF
ncbi:MAG: helix-hairpin-helix domain-containing protein, partial [Geminicoccaceae bacterium]